MRIAQTRHLEIYVTQDGKRPFIEWLESFKDKTIKYQIQERLDRISLGNFGDCKSLEQGVYELRLTMGAKLSYLFWTGKKENSSALMWWP